MIINILGQAFCCVWGLFVVENTQVLGYIGTVGLWWGFSSPNTHKHNLFFQTYLNKVL